MKVNRLMLQFSQTLKLELIRFDFYWFEHLRGRYLNLELVASRELNVRCALSLLLLALLDTLEGFESRSILALGKMIPLRLQGRL